MRIQYLSDVHFEFHADDGESFVRSMSPDGVDAVVIAGDLAVGEGVGPALDRFCQRYPSATVVYVTGNHEYYGATREVVDEAIRAARARHSNLRCLDADIIEIAGVRFLGAPLWFARSAKASPFKWQMNDFHQIPDFEPWVYEENARAVRFLERELREGDVVVTHHLPAQASVAPRWKTSILNAFFVCDLEELIRARRPSVWVHGHTHDSVDVRVGETRVVCNPFGYVRHALNPAFDDAATIDV